MGVGRFNNPKLGGRRSSSAMIPPWRARLPGTLLSTGTRQGVDWTRTTLAISSEPNRLAGAIGIASQAMAVLYLARPMCLRCHCPPPAVPVTSAWLRTADVRPVTAAPVWPLSAYRPEILIGVLFCTCHEGSRRQGLPGLCDLVGSVVAHRVQVGRSWSVSTVEVVYASQATGDSR